MVPLRIMLLMLPLAVVVACNARKVPGAGDGGQYGSPADSLFFSIERTPCLGTCPAYRIRVHAAGTATYEGIANVSRMGRYETRLPPGVLATLLHEAEAIGFFDLQDRYDSPVTDIPSTRLRMVSGGRDKSILARTGVPPTLRSFAAKADSLPLGADWRPIVASR